MKKIFSLIAVLFCIAGSVWGQTLTVTPKQIQCPGETTGKLIVEIQDQGIIDYPITVRVTRRGMNPAMEKEILVEPVEPIVFDVLPSDFEYTVSIIGYPSLTVNDLFIFQIFIPELVIIGMPVLGVDCPDLGKITIGAGGGTTPYLYVLVPDGEPEISSGQTISNKYTFTGLSRENTYNVYIKDANGCTSNTIEELEFAEYKPLNLKVDKEPISVTCHGDEDGEVRAIVDGGTTPIWFELNGVSQWQEDNLFDELAPGLHYITVYDDDGWGCMITIQFDVEEPDIVTVKEYKANPPSCSDGTDGYISDLTAEGGSGKGYTFSISSNGTDNWSELPSSFSGLTADVSYFVKATDDNGCESQAPQKEITIPNPPDVLFTLKKTDPECAGTTTGSIIINDQTYPQNPDYPDILEYKIEKKVNGVFEPVRGYEGADEDGFVTGTNFTGLSEGTYRITGRIKGKDCDPYIMEMTLNDPNAVNITVLPSPDTRNVTCYGGSNGRIRIDVSGGTDPPPNVSRTQYRSAYGYSYRKKIDEETWGAWTVFTGWAPIPNANNITISSTLSAGIYEIKGKQRIEQRTRNGNGNGNGNGGWGIWTPMPGGERCESEVIEVVITQPDPLQIIVKDTVTTCPTSNDGVIIVSAEGGAPPYQFSRIQGATISWDNNTTFSPLSPNTYTFQVLDANLCTYNQANVNIHQPDARKTATVVAATGIGLTPSLTMLLDPDPITCNTDVTLSVNVTQKQDYRDLEFQLLKNGAGATEWISEEEFNEDGFTIPALESQTSDNYQISVRYAAPYNVAPLNGCPITTNIKTITIPAPITISLKDSTSISCHNGTDGTITVEASGGYQGSGSKYMFKIETIPTGSNRNTDDWFESNVAGDKGYQLINAGSDTTFIFTVKSVYGADVDACPSEIEMPSIRKRLANPDELALTLVSHSQYLCSYNDGTGNITVKATGGTLGDSSPDDEYIYKLYRYNYSDSKYDDVPLSELRFILETPAVFSALDSGNYKIEVYDLNGCSDAITDVIITRFDNIEPVISIKDVSCYGDIDGSVDVVSITGGSGTYEQPYQWMKWNEMTDLYDIVVPNPNSLPSGKYALIVTDTEVCTVTHEFEVVQPREIMITVNTTPITCTGYDGTMKINVSGGGYSDTDISYSYSIDGGATWMDEDDFENLELEPGTYLNLGSGTYHIQVQATYTKNSKGTILTQSVSCVAIGNPVTFDHLDKFEIIPIEPDDISHIWCPNETDLNNWGKIMVTARGGTPVSLPDGYVYELYSYNYTDNKYDVAPIDIKHVTPAIFTELDSSMYKPYRILAYDANSCKDSVFVTIKRPKSIVFTAEETISILPCDNAVTDIMLVITSSDPGPYVYRVNEKDGATGAWSNPFTTNTVTIPNIGKGEYIIEVAYAFGKDECENHDIQENTPSITITVDEVEFLVRGRNPACYKESSGTVLVTTLVPTNTLRLYQWNSETEDFELTTYPFLTPAQHHDLENIPGITGGFVELPSGRYRVKAIAGNCSYESTILDLNDPPLLYPNILSTINPCSGQTNGVIRIEAEGGTPQYTFEIHTLNPVTNQFQIRRTEIADKEAEFSNLGQNTFYIRIVDANGCNTRHLPVDGLPFFYPDQLEALFAEGDITDVTCNSEDNGKAIVTVKGGRKQYTYIWNLEKEAFDLKPPIVRESLEYKWEKLDDSGFVFTFENDSTVTGLTAGDYKVTVKQDVCNMTVEKTFKITEPNELTITLDNEKTKGGITCDKMADGQIVVEISGGTPVEKSSEEPLRYYDYKVYQYDETDNPREFNTSGKTIEIEYNSETKTETYTIKGMESGKYMIEVADGICTPASVDIEIINPEPFEVTVTKENVSCSDQTDGSIKVTIEGGVVPYHITVEDNVGAVRGPLDIDPDTYVYTPNDNYLVTVGIDRKVEVTFTGLHGGSKENPEKTYKVFIQDDNECKVEEDRTIITPDEFVFKLSVGAAGSILEDTIYLCNTSDRVPLTPSYGGVNASITELWRNGVKMPAVPAPLRVSQPGTYFGVARSVDGGCISISNDVYVLLYEPSADFRKHDETCSIQGSIKIVNPSGGINNPELNFAYRVFDVDNNTYLSDNFNQYPNDSIRTLAGNYYIEMKSYLEEICPNTILRIPLETANPNFITISTKSTIDLTNLSDWFITTDPTCFNGYGRIKVFNPISDITDNILFRITDKDGNDVSWLSLSKGNDETEFNILPAGKYFLEIEDRDNGCKTEKIPFEIGADLPKINIEFVSDEILDFINCEKGYIEFVVELMVPDNRLTLDDLKITHTNIAGNLLFTPENDEPVTDDKMEIVGYKRTYGAYLAGSGKTTIKVAIDNNCYVDTDHNFTVPEELTIDYKAGTGECNSSSVVVSFTINGGEGATYTLFGLGNEVSVTATVDHKNTNYIKQLEEGVYDVYVKDVSGCQSNVLKVTVEHPEQVNLDLVERNESEGMATCENSVNGYIRLNDDQGYTYMWENGMDGNVLLNVGKGAYKVTISKGSCSVEASYEVKVANTIEVSIMGNGGGNERNEFCPGDEVILVGTIRINGTTWTPSNDIQGASAFWVIPPDGDTQEFLSNIPLPPIQASNANVQLLVSYLTTNNSTCTASAEFELKAAPLPTIDFPKDVIYITQGSEIHLDVTTSDFESCMWTAIPDIGQTEGLDCPPNTGILASPETRYELILTLKNEFGCEFSKSIFVDQPLDFLIPNAFTPNGDGTHDTWKFRNIEQYSDFFDVQVVVFNRGGTPLWEGKGYDNYNVVWDGRRNGQDVPIGPYWYVVKLVPKSGVGPTITRTGSVTITR